MSKLRACIDEDLAAWIHLQHLFFVATAPLSETGHVNCSPKGGDTLRVLSPLEVAYLDYTGSGAETVGHLRENGRIVVMFCAFEGKPNIVRLHGRGEVILPGDSLYSDLLPKFPIQDGARAIVKVSVHRISTSCGLSVPLMDFVADRDGLNNWARAQGPEKLAEYRSKKNAETIDGLRALD